MKALFQFGESIEGFDYRVINEREARASAGIMFLFGMLSLFSVYLQRTLFWAEFFSVTFVIEFTIRTLISPQYAPYMLLGRLFVSNQVPEWVDARPKQFAWFLGWVLGLIMTYYIVFDIISLVRLGICWLCLFLMFFESAFGICLGCMLYQAIAGKPQNCPGEICSPVPKRKFEKSDVVILSLFLIAFFVTYSLLRNARFTERPKIVVIDE